MRLIGGARPTGGLHLGHLIGMLTPFRQWLDEADEAFFVIADLHMLTTNPTAESTGLLRGRLHQLVAEGIAVGIEPGSAHFLQQSQLVEQGQMYAIIQSLTPWPALTEQPSYLEMTSYAAPTLGLLGYSVLEAADAVVLRVTDMAVGEHNVRHVEVAQHAVRQLNAVWDLGLPVPEARSGGPNLLGLDGSFKMSKSLGNAIQVAASDEEIDAAVARMTIFTADGRCVPAEIVAGLTGADQSALATAARADQVSADRLRALVAETVHSVVDPIRERAAQVLADPDFIEDVLGDGAARARDLAEETLQLVRDGMRINPPARRLSPRL